MTNVSRFLKQISAEVSYINSLFVSAFIKLNGLTFSEKNYLSHYKDIDNQILEKFLTFISGDVDLERLVKLFEFVISPSDKIINGAIYTPKNIRTTIIHHCLGHLNKEQLRNVRVCDIACGCGGFLMNVAEYIHLHTQKSFKDIFHENIYGIDIQNYSIERTKILLSLLALSYGEDEDFCFNLLQADTLDFCMDNWNSEFSSFDVIVGNPPYVCSRNVSTVTKEKMLKYEVAQSGHPDLYIPFFQIAYEMLNSNGVMGYITMNSFIHSVNGRNLRKYLSSKNNSVNIIDFRGYQVFNKRSTYTCLFFLNKGVYSGTINYLPCETGSIAYPLKYASISYSSLNNFKGWNLNDNNEIEKIDSIGIPLGKYCNYRHGIATLCNKVYIFKPKYEDKSYYYLEGNGQIYPIEKEICRDIVNPNKLNSKIDFESIIEKVIFPYKQDGHGKICIIEEEILQSEFPYTYAYLLSKKNILDRRDKGKAKDYPRWYEFGRTQSLQLPPYKLFLPKFANNPIKCVLNDNPNLLLYNGIAFVSDSKKHLQILQKIIESDIFWNYIIKNAKPYASNYYSLSGVDIKNFGIPNFTLEEQDYLLKLNNKIEIENFLNNYYAI